MYSSDQKTALIQFFHCKPLDKVASNSGSLKEKSFVWVAFNKVYDVKNYTFITPSVGFPSYNVAY